MGQCESSAVTPERDPAYEEYLDRQCTNRELNLLEWVYINQQGFTILEARQTIERFKTDALLRVRIRICFAQTLYPAFQQKKI